MTGDVFILQMVNDILTWVDAYDEWGVNLEDGALSALMSPPPMKDFIESGSRLSHGKQIIAKTPRYDSRDLTLQFHIVASSKEDFFSKYSAFCNDVLSKGTFALKTKYQPARTVTQNGSTVTIPAVVYHLVYKSCSQYTQYRQEMAKFTLKVSEPDPTNRTEVI